MDSVFTEEQQRSIADSLVEKEQLTEEEANQSLRSAGVEPSQPKPEPEHEIDITFPVPDASEYQIDGLNRADAEHMEWDGTVRTWLSEAGFTKEIGNYLIKE